MGTGSSPGLATLVAVTVASIAVAACRDGGETRPPQFECMRVHAGSDTPLKFTPSAAGMLRVWVKERGISIIATLDGDKSTAAASPVERFGHIVLTTRTAASQPHRLTLTVEDSPQISGEACVSAQVIPDSERSHAAAEEALAMGGRAVQSHAWDRAFASYLVAVDGFDGVHDFRRSSIARQALAELAYLRLDRKRDAYALASEALADLHRAQEAERSRAEQSSSDDSLTVGLLSGLQGKALLDMPGAEAKEVEPEVRRLFAGARVRESADPLAARELPRLDIMTGFLEYLLNEQDQARAIFEQAARRCSELQDWDCQAMARQNLAALALEHNDLATALEASKEALRLLPPGLDPQLAAAIWNNLSLTQGTAGLLGDSEQSSATAMQLYIRLADCPGVRKSLARTGTLLLQTGSLTDAENTLQRAASATCTELFRGRVNAGERGRTPLCERPLDSADLGAENRLIISNALLGIGQALSLEGRLDEAQRCLDADEPYATDSVMQLRLAQARGTVLLGKNDWQGARSQFEKSVRIGTATHLPPSYYHLSVARLGIVAAALLAGDAAAAVNGAAAELRTAAKGGDIEQTIASLRLLARAYGLSGQAERGARILKVGADLVAAVPIDALDGEQRATYLATQHDVFAELIELQAAKADQDAARIAFATAEHGKARSLRYALSQATLEDAATPSGAPQARYQRLLRDVSALAATGPHTTVERLIDQLDAVALREVPASKPFDPADLARSLQRMDAVLVEYAAGTRSMYAFVIQGDRVEVASLGELRGIGAAAAELREKLQSAESPLMEVRAAATRLAERILWPIASRLSSKRIIFVPDDALHTIPFGVLPWSAASNQLVVQKAETSLAPSALLLASQRPPGRAPSVPRAVLIGDPVFRVADWQRECAAGRQPTATVRSHNVGPDWTESLPALPGSRAEIQAAVDLLRVSRPTAVVHTYRRCAAVPSAVHSISGTLDLLHIATHARVDAQRPRLSALALTPEVSGDRTVSTLGLLDILDLKLNAGLVVLSACDTSRGRLLPGEGVLGPAQAFLQAGAATVIATYWRIDDRATARFMQHFYRHLLVEHLPAAGALRQAQLDQVTGLSYDWAAFSLYGRPDFLL